MVSVSLKYLAIVLNKLTLMGLCRKEKNIYEHNLKSA